MPTTLQPNGVLRYTDASGRTAEIGPEHPEYQRYQAQYRTAALAHPARARLLAGVFMLAGVIGWWYNWHTLAGEGYYSIRLCVFGPFALFGGLLMMVYPEAAGPMRPDTPRAQKLATYATLAVFALASGIDMYLIQSYRP